MKEFEKFISPFISQQFPEIYREEGPLFVMFVKAYFEWLESQDQVLYQSKRLLEYRDIDKTVDKFIDDFKNKYMFPIPKDIRGDKVLLQKHIKEVYGSKGTERGLKLLFQLLFGDTIDVYKPGEDVLRLSDGEWTRNIYLEVSAKPYNTLFVNEFIKGRVSGAKGYVEKIQIKYVNNKAVNIFFLTDVEGDFLNDETVLIDESKLAPGVTSPVSAVNSPKIIGSLTSVTDIDSGFGFNLGDLLEVQGTGRGGKVVVTKLEDRDGTLSFKLKDGGSGYTLDHTVITVAGPVTNVIITTGGYGYSNSDIIRISNGTVNATANIQTNSVGGISTITLTNGGNGFINSSSCVLFVANTSNLASVGTGSSLSAEIAGGGEGAAVRVGSIIDTKELWGSPVKINSIGKDTVHLGSTNSYSDMIIAQLSYPANNGYGLASNVAAGFDTIIKDALDFQTYVVGSIGKIFTINPGSGYTTNLQVTAVDSVISGLALLDTVSEAGRGITGRGYLGNNAIITAVSGYGSDAISEVKVVDSGIGYQQQELVRLVSLSNTSLEASGLAALERQGRDRGQFKSTRGFLNSDKYIHDSYYYQDYSYEVRSSIVFNKYSDLLRKLWHPAGVEKFGRVLISSEVAVRQPEEHSRMFVGDGTTTEFTLPFNPQP